MPAVIRAKDEPGAEHERQVKPQVDIPSGGDGNETSRGNQQDPCNEVNSWLSAKRAPPVPRREDGQVGKHHTDFVEPKGSVLRRALTADESTESDT